MTQQMKDMLAMFAAGLSACTAMHGLKNSGRTLDALVSRGLVSLQPRGVWADVVITDRGRAVAWQNLTAAA